MTVLALDIGGANLKIADGLGYAASRAFPLWKQPQLLAVELRQLIDPAPEAEVLAVTMTGELADCFETKSQGVWAILTAVEQAAPEHRLRVYLGNGKLVSTEEAYKQPILAAASNWHVLANFASRYCDDSPGMLIDIGSTTTDLVPLDRQRLFAQAKTDPQRLTAGELVYTGVERTPICAICRTLPYQNGESPIAAEFFATTADAYLLLGHLEEQPENTDTADGRPFTKSCAHARLARMVCADTTMFSMEDAAHAAESVCQQQLELLLSAFHQNCISMGRVPVVFVLAGQGEFLARMLLDRFAPVGQIVSLSSTLGSKVSTAACAHALAVLVREQGT